SAGLLIFRPGGRRGAGKRRESQNGCVGCVVAFPAPLRGAWTFLRPDPGAALAEGELAPGYFPGPLWGRHMIRQSFPANEDTSAGRLNRYPRDEREKATVQGPNTRSELEMEALHEPRPQSSMTNHQFGAGD